MSGLLPAMLVPAVSTKIAPVAAVLAFGFVIGVMGHVARSRMLIITGIVIVCGMSFFFVFVLAKLY